LYPLFTRLTFDKNSNNGTDIKVTSILESENNRPDYTNTFKSAKVRAFAIRYISGKTTQEEKDSIYKIWKDADEWRKMTKK
jgi:hypothetical protein